MLWVHLFVYFIAFVGVWIGADQVVTEISRLAKSWKLPAFMVSFFLLGILTSLPEIAIGTSAIINDTPIIYAGNLLGGVTVMFLLIIPLLGIVGNGVKIPDHLGRKQLFLILVVTVAPSLLSADRKISFWEGVLMLLIYGLLFVVMAIKMSVLERVTLSVTSKVVHSGRILFKVLIGVAILWISSNLIVNSTIYFADLLKLSPFFVSLIVVSLGTNIPEISIILRSVKRKKQNVALADYLGSASANTLLFGVFTLIYARPISLPNNFLQRFVFLAIGLVLFYVFARSKRTISRKESIALLILYCVFVIIELLVMSDTPAI